MLWNPDLDHKKILEDVESKYYGKAYPPMKKYHDYRRELWNNSSYCMGYPYNDQRRPQLLSAPGAKERLLGYLAEAYRLAGNDKLLKNRIRDDSNWLQRYWIAPNDKMRAQMGRTCSAPTRIGTIKIDGDPSDAEWNRAWHTSDFRYTFGDNTAGKAVDPAQKTTLSILSDKDNLYFRIIANMKDPSKLVAGCKEKDGDVFRDDSIELFIMPPSAAQEYYQVAVSASGAVYDARWPGNHKDVDLGVVAKVKRNAKGYVAEVKVPLAKIGKAERGALWKIHATRCDATAKHTHPNLYKQMSLDGTIHHDTVNYRGIVIGTPIVKNGTFEDVDKKGKPKFRTTFIKCSVISSGASKALKIPGTWAYQLLHSPPMHQQNFPRKIRISFRASGKGVLHVSAMRYTDTRNPKRKTGIDRKNHPTTAIYKTELDNKTKLCIPVNIPSTQRSG